MIMVGKTNKKKVSISFSYSGIQMLLATASRKNIFGQKSKMMAFLPLNTQVFM